MAKKIKKESKRNNNFNLSFEISNEMVATAVRAVTEIAQLELERKTAVFQKETTDLQEKNRKLVASINEMDRRQDDLLKEIRNLRTELQEIKQEKNLLTKIDA